MHVGVFLGSSVRVSSPLASTRVFNQQIWLSSTFTSNWLNLLSNQRTPISLSATWYQVKEEVSKEALRSARSHLTARGLPSGIAAHMFSTAGTKRKASDDARSESPDGTPSAHRNSPIPQRRIGVVAAEAEAEGATSAAPDPAPASASASSVAATSTSSSASACRLQNTTSSASNWGSERLTASALPPHSPLAAGLDASQSHEPTVAASGDHSPQAFEAPFLSFFDLLAKRGSRDSRKTGNALPSLPPSPPSTPRATAEECTGDPWLRTMATGTDAQIVPSIPLPAHGLAAPAAVLILPIAVAMMLHMNTLTLAEHLAIVIVLIYVLLSANGLRRQAALCWCITGSHHII